MLTKCIKSSKNRQNAGDYSKKSNVFMLHIFILCIFAAK